MALPASPSSAFPFRSRAGRIARRAWGSNRRATGGEATRGAHRRGPTDAICERQGAARSAVRPRRDPFHAYAPRPEQAFRRQGHTRSEPAQRPGIRHHILPPYDLHQSRCDLTLQHAPPKTKRSPDNFPGCEPTIYLLLSLSLPADQAPSSPPPAYWPPAWLPSWPCERPSLPRPWRSSPPAPRSRRARRRHAVWPAS